VEKKNIFAKKHENLYFFRFWSGKKKAKKSKNTLLTKENPVLGNFLALEKWEKTFDFMNICLGSRSKTPYFHIKR